MMEARTAAETFCIGNKTDDGKRQCGDFVLYLMMEAKTAAETFCIGNKTDDGKRQCRCRQRQ